MKPLFWYAIWSAIGVTLIALPDSGPRLITFSDAHGAGLVLASVVSDFTAWWAVGAGLLTTVQFGLYALVARPE